MKIKTLFVLALIAGLLGAYQPAQTMMDKPEHKEMNDEKKQSTERGAIELMFQALSGQLRQDKAEKFRLLGSHAALDIISRNIESIERFIDLEKNPERIKALNQLLQECKQYFHLVQLRFSKTNNTDEDLIHAQLQFLGVTQTNTADQIAENLETRRTHLVNICSNFNGHRKYDGPLVNMCSALFEGTRHQTALLLSLLLQHTPPANLEERETIGQALHHAVHLQPMAYTMPVFTSFSMMNHAGLT